MTPVQIYVVSITTLAFAGFIIFGLLYNRFDKDWMVNVCGICFFVFTVGAIVTYLAAIAKMIAG